MSSYYHTRLVTSRIPHRRFYFDCIVSAKSSVADFLKTFSSGQKRTLADLGASCRLDLAMLQMQLQWLADFSAAAADGWLDR
ncbi:unnamed protein product [Sphagnum tenellum]